MKLFQELLGFIKRNGIKTVFIHAFETYIGAILRALPGVEGLFLRGLFYRAIFRSSKGGLILYPSVYIIFSHRISVGERVAINVNTYLDGRGGISIGNGVLIGPNCILTSTGHHFEDVTTPIYLQPVKYGPIVIEDDVCIGGNTVITPGVTIGKGSVIAACTLVVKDVPPYCLFGGVPGKVIGSRK